MDNETLESLTDLREKGRMTVHGLTAIDRRLFVQLLGFGGCNNPDELIRALTESGMNAVLYDDLNDPFGVGIVTYSEDPAHFVTTVRSFIANSPFSSLVFKPEYAMFGRTYARGFESDLEEAIIAKPKRTLQDASLEWGVWYPLRRKGEFEQLSAEEQRDVLTEHGKMGHAFGRIGAGHDVRLACHGLNKGDNDFVIGVLGPDLHPLSVIVQSMRKSIQTSRYIERLGPFFTGRVRWRSAPETAEAHRSGEVASSAESRTGQ